MSESRFPWRTVSLLSLALNLLLIGAAVGGFAAGVRLEREAPQAVVERMPGPRAFFASLPEEVRTDVRGEFARSWTETREVRLAARQARREAFEAVAAEPYDVNRTKAAFARLRAADQSVVGVFHDNMADAFGRLTPAQRREALESLRRAPPAYRGEGSGEQPSEAEPTRAPGEGAATWRERREERRRLLRERLRQRQQP